MKEIIFVRHAKSSWSHNVGDKERPLKNRGINDSHLVSSAFKKSKFIPNVIFTSPATRAKMTCEIFIQNLGFTEINKEIIDDIYDFGGNSLLNFIKSLDNSLNKVMIFGHNYAFTSVVNAYGSKYVDNVTTSGLVWLKFYIDDWKELNKGTTILTIFPRDLK